MESAERQWNFFFTKIPSIPSPVKLAHTPGQGNSFPFVRPVFPFFIFFFHHKSVK
jgi:hypothetical protein